MLTTQTLDTVLSITVLPPPLPYLARLRFGGGWLEGQLARLLGHRQRALHRL